MISIDEDFGIFELEIVTESLNEVELVGERTEVEIRLDKRIYMLAKISLYEEVRLQMY